VIHGLRQWSIEFDEEGNGRLRALNGIAWARDGAPTVAACAGGWSSSLHQAPGHSCQCGLYAYHPRRESASEVFFEADLDVHSLGIAGLVEAWGAVEVHRDGFRAQYARPVALILRREHADGHLGGLVRAIAHAHRAEVLVMDDPRELEEHCRAHGLGMGSATVEELLRAPEEPAEREPVDATVGGGAAPKPRARSARERIVQAGVMVAGVIWCLVVAAFWVLVGYGVLAAIIGGFSSDGSRSATVRARPHLKLVDQAVLGAASREPVFVAVVKNHHPRRAALDVGLRVRIKGGGRVARLTGSGRLDHPADVPPGRSAVAVDFLRAVPVGELAQPDLQVGAFRSVDKSPMGRVTARLDQRPCALVAEVTARRRLDHLELIGIARREGRIDGGGEFRVDSVPRGRSTHDLGRPGAHSCGANPPRWSLYPALAFSNGKWGS
jgi:hypothetical protein